LRKNPLVLYNDMTIHNFHARILTKDALQLIKMMQTYR
jgi:hypothetical protein